MSFVQNAFGLEPRPGDTIVDATGQVDCIVKESWREGDEGLFRVESVEGSLMLVEWIQDSWVRV